MESTALFRLEDCLALGETRIRDEILLVHQGVLRTAREELDASLALARGVASGAIPLSRVIRLYTPRPTLAMSRRESRKPGYPDACAAARARGFETAIRPTGGRAVAYDESCLVFDVVWQDEGHVSANHMFEAVASALVDAFVLLGIDARVGAVVGEYCPGEFSVNARGRVKLVGTSQRAVHGARLLSGMMAFGEVEPLVAVLHDANRMLDLSWDESTFGSVSAECPGLIRAAGERAVGGALAALPWRHH